MHGSRDKKLRAHVLSMSKNQRVKWKGHKASTCTICSLTSSSKASSLKLPTTAAPPGTKYSNAQDDGIISSSTTTGGYVIFYQLLPALVDIQIYIFKSPHCFFFLLKLFRRVVCTEGDVPVLRFHSLFSPVSSSTARSWSPYLLSLTS